MNHSFEYFNANIHFHQKLNFRLKVSTAILITFLEHIITNHKIEEITILKPLDVYVLPHFQHFPANSEIVRILYIKRTYILCNNIR